MALTQIKNNSYPQVKDTLRKQFEPSMKVDLYKAQLQNRNKQSRESWGDFADEVCVLVEKAYLHLREDSRECIALNHYLSQIDNPKSPLM